LKNWCVSSGKQLPGDYQKIIQNILSSGYVQDSLDVMDIHKKIWNRKSIKLPELKRPKDQQYFTKIISQIALEELL